jgi:hypothetical protein
MVFSLSYKDFFVVTGMGIAFLYHLRLLVSALSFLFAVSGRPRGFVHL